MSKALAILGTASDVGKSLVCAGLGRLLHRKGCDVAPFKSQNMSLNSYVTVEGGEMGRAQVLQAQACGVVPHVDMNPILLKPEADHRSQVVVQGKVWGRHDAQEYFGCRPELFRFVRESYERIAARHEILIIEGAGSAAEVNLRNRDLVNWPVVEMADASVILVADIDRGGVFAQIIGTLDLLEPHERQRVIGVIVNKFRGDRRLFDDGVQILEERTGVSVLGVVPFLRQLELDQEDSVTIDSQAGKPFSPQRINVAVVLLPHMSNFTDFNAIAAEEDVAFHYIKRPDQLKGADVVILPGTKNTLGDLQYLYAQGFCEFIQDYGQKGTGELVGLCGGFQMLGKMVADPRGVEEGGEVPGLGLLDMTSELLPIKHTSQVTAQPLFLSEGQGCVVKGYEIHMGMSHRSSGLPCFEIMGRQGECDGEILLEGMVSSDGLLWGTYIHGVFDEPEFRRAWLNRLRKRKGLKPLDVAVSETVSRRMLTAIDRWASHLEQHVNLQPIFSYLNIN
ncbi:cobyric acid synthase [Candidatus Nitronereus thalassa]|uniref:Cobyric acid synthase n=1 Tax=Candidatus Nitronereus thalassa TaxID=3020898 RepID=A0ABU3KBB7_9BACT|nr:cobyric acid synthase [Candidatus Nitronereus thalassa]MDT7043790.1 cobyric acid synthase [Candidatus Nitronereus thalassa]